MNLDKEHTFIIQQYIKYIDKFRIYMARRQLEAPEARAIPKNKHSERLTPAIQLRHTSRDLTCNKDNVF